MTQNSSITIRRLDPRLKRELRVRAATHGRSMEEEAREILRTSLSSEPLSGKDFIEKIRRRAAAAGYVTLKLPKRGPGRPPPDFK